MCVKEPWVHHACGHDGHMANLLGSAMVLSKLRDQIRGSIKFLFQPAEELGAGALAMIEDGFWKIPEWIVFTGCMVGRRILVDKSQLDLVLCWPQQLGSKFSSLEKAVMLRCPAEPSTPSWWVENRRRSASFGFS